MLALLDSGSSHTFVRRSALPANCEPLQGPERKSSTLAGPMTSSHVVHLKHTMFPEFYKSRFVENITAQVFDTPCRYDLIIGRDVLRAMEIKMDFSTSKVTCDESHIPMRLFPQAPNDDARLAEQLLDDVLNDHLYNDEAAEVLSSDTTTDLDEDDPDGYKAKTIKHSRYEGADIEDVVDKCRQLSKDQRQQLLKVLQKYPRLFTPTLRKYPHEQIHLDVDQNAVPHRSRAYTVPHHQRAVFKKELDRLVEIGVLEPTGRSEWIAGTFIIPKKDGRVRWISDFRGLNKVLRRKVYPLPRIGDILSRRTGYKFLSKLDISMQYYTFEMDEESRDKCTIATPFGLYRYCRLPMGVSQSPDIAQEIMERTLRHIDDIEIYIDDIGIFSKTWDEHVSTIEQVCQALEANGFTVNPRKCEWAVQETDFLGHWFTPTGVRPWKKKIDSILKMQAPTDLKQLRSFLGLVNYYRDMWPRRSHVLAPLTALTGTRQFQWNADHQQAFQRMKAIVASDALLAWPDHNEPFQVEADASDYQLGAVIKQHRRPVAYYTRKLNQAQRNYTTIEKELLSIVETFKEFRSLLLGARITVHTDHKNLTHKLTQFSTQRVMRWRLLLEEFNPSFTYKQGTQNFIADALSRVPTAPLERESTTPILDPTDELTDGCYYNNAPWAANSIRTSRWDAAQTSGLASNTRFQGNPNGDSRPIEESDTFQGNVSDASCAEYSYEQVLAHLPLDSFLQHAELDEEGGHPFQFHTLASYQRKASLARLVRERPDDFTFRRYGNEQLVCTRQGNHYRIALTAELVPKLVRYYHSIMAHVEGADRMIASLKQHYHHPLLEKEIRAQISACEVCQRMKRGSKVQGESAPRDASATPWQEVHCDTIGPWTIELRARNLTFRAMTMVDPATNLVEIAPIKTTTASEGAATVENAWIARYPRPIKCVSDQGPEFGHEFVEMLNRNGIAHSYSTSRNPQGNSIIERTHQAIGQVLRTVVENKNPRSVVEGQAVIDECLATAMHACRCAAQGALNNHAPGALAFRRDMFLDVPLIADFVALQQRRQDIVDQRVMRANAKRIRHDYQVGEKVWKHQHLGLSDKLKPTAVGPYPITRVHTNGTVTIRLAANVQERINIRRVRPARTHTLPDETSLRERESES